MELRGRHPLRKPHELDILAMRNVRPSQRTASRIRPAHNAGRLPTPASRLRRSLSNLEGRSQGRRLSTIASYLANEPIRGERTSKSGRNGRICGGTRFIDNVAINKTQSLDGTRRLKT
jgi:hypothetical protein